MEHRSANDTEPRSGSQPRSRRVDALRNEQALLEAAAAVFAELGVDAPVREIAARAGVGMGTVYRHFPSRSQLVVAVYRHQVEACADTGPSIARGGGSPARSLEHWVGLFVDFLVTKHGMAKALQGGGEGDDALHTYFIERLVPACAELLGAARDAGQIEVDISAYELMRGVGNLCSGPEGGERYDARRLVGLLMSGLLVPAAA